MIRRVLCLLSLVWVVLLALLLFSGVALAAPGDLDVNFGAEGKLVTDFGPGEEEADDAALQPDGKILVAGTADDGNDVAMARYNADGSLDAGFGSGGKIVTDIGVNDGQSGHGAALALLSNGKIVVAATSYNRESGYSPEFTLLRYNADGSLDSAFGSGGKVITDVGWAASYAIDLVVQQDGKILVAGHSQFKFNGKDDFVLVRYNADGTLDSAYGQGGIVTDLSTDI